MSKKHSAHLRGERGLSFADLVRGMPPEHILCASLDISKYFHVAMIHNGLGEIVTPTFEVDIYQSGFDQLCQKIDKAKVHTQAQVVLYCIIVLLLRIYHNREDSVARHLCRLLVAE